MFATHCCWSGVAITACSTSIHVFLLSLFYFKLFCLTRLIKERRSDLCCSKRSQRVKLGSLQPRIMGFEGAFELSMSRSEKLCCTDARFAARRFVLMGFDATTKTTAADDDDVEKRELLCTTSSTTVSTPSSIYFNALQAENHELCRRQRRHKENLYQREVGSANPDKELVHRNISFRYSSSNNNRAHVSGRSCGRPSLKPFQNVSGFTKNRKTAGSPEGTTKILRRIIDNNLSTKWRQHNKHHLMRIR